MKNKPILFILFSLLLGSFFALQGATLPHQGRVLISGKAFEGTGSFRFALVDTAGNLVWNHQGTTGEPTTDLTLEVKGGFYSIALGDPSVAGMADLPDSLFGNYAGLKLRIWFNDGTNGLQQLGTDQTLLVAPYALSADSGSAQRIAALEASLAQALARIATLEQPPSTGGSGTGSTGGSSPIQNYSANRSYARGALVILGQESYIATANVPFDVAPPNASYWTNLSVAANALNVPVETIPTLSTDTILNALPDTTPSGPTQPGPSLPGEVAATSRSYLFVDGPAEYQEVTLPSAAQNVGKEYVIHSKIGEVFVKGNKGEIESKDYAIITNKDSNHLTTALATSSNSKSFVSDGKQWKLVGGRRNQVHNIPSDSGGFDIAFGSGVFVDIVKGAGSSSPAHFAAMGNHLYFSANDGINGSELWKTDGTVTGTMMVKDLNPGANGSHPTGLTAFNNALYFAATDANGTELWKSDGTATGTLLFKEFVPGLGSGTPTNIWVDGNQLRFKAAQESWSSDGTLAGTVVQAPSFTDNPYAKLGNWYYFAGSDSNGTELWRSDALSYSGQLFKDLYPGSTTYQWPSFNTIVNSSNPGNFFLFNNTLYFSATDANGRELWKSDGTIAGTVMVKELYPGSQYNSGTMTSQVNGGSPKNFQVIDNELYFSASDANGTALWKTDGTANGTVKVLDLPNLNGELIKFGNALYYQGRDVLGFELHRKELNVSTTGGPSAPTGATHVVDLNSAVNLQMIRVEPGTFTMGSPLSEAGRGTDETQHQVTLTKPFYLGKYEVTQAQYEAVMTGNPNGLSATPSQYSGNPNRPVETVSWDDVQVFLTRLNAAEQAAGRLPAGWSYVLPTEAEWEYACRAGTTTAYSWGDTITPNNANYSTSGIGQTTNVGQYASNPWGFYDMHGNVWEWSADWYAAYSTSQLVDPIGPYTGSSRIVRGGSYSNVGTYSRAAMRNFFPPDNRNEGWGFRLAFKQQ